LVPAGALYVELPDHGQCSFHSASAASNKEFAGQWDSSKPVHETILEFCDFVFQSEEKREIRDTDLMPFGKHVGAVIGDLPGSYFGWLAEWEGLEQWSSIRAIVERLAGSSAR
jgi:Putative quorum-sensing-regulated virulence factor